MWQPAIFENYVDHFKVREADLTGTVDSAILAAAGRGDERQSNHGLRGVLRSSFHFTSNRN